MTERLTEAQKRSGGAKRLALKAGYQIASWHAKTLSGRLVTRWQITRPDGGRIETPYQTQAEAWRAAYDDSLKLEKPGGPGL